MATKRLATVVTAALALMLLTTAALLAATKDPGRGELNSNNLRVPIIRSDGLVPHSDGWNEQYLDRYGVTELRITVPSEKAEPIRGGIAENYSRPNKAPVISHPAYAPHSDEWNAPLLDRYTNTQLPSYAGEGRPGKVRGGPLEWQVP